MRKRPPRLTPRAGRCALRPKPLCLAVLLFALLLLSQTTAPARQSQDGRVSFILDLDELQLPASADVQLRAEVKSKLHEHEPPRRLTISLSREKPPRELETNAPVIDAAQRLSELGGRTALVDLSVIWNRYGGAWPYSTVYLRVTELSWPGSEAASLWLLGGSRKPELVVGGLPLPASVYQIKLFRREASGEERPLLDVQQEVAAGRDHEVSLRAPDLVEALKEKFVNREGLLFTVIVGLVAVLLAVLKDKIKEAVNWLLDNLGKYGRGKLAQRRFRRRYLNVVTYNHKYLRLVGFNTAGISRPLLEEVFVSLRIAGRPGRPAGDGAGQSSVPFATALRQYPKLVILGGPGAGKTTTLSYALITFAQNRGRERFGIAEPYLPIFIPLRRLSDSTRSIVDDLTDEATQILPPEVLRECPRGYFEKMLKAGRCVVMLDGLDEVVDEAAHRRVAAKINDLVAAHPDSRYVVTCRQAGWRSLLSGEFVVLETQDFNREEIQRFVHGWHRAVITQAEHSRLQLEYPDRKRFEAEWAKHYEGKVRPAIDARTRNLLHAVDESNRILAIAVNPMLLSLISLVHFVRHILPRGRTILYSQCIELLVDAWDRSRDIISQHQVSRINAQQKEAVLREIAFEFQRQGVGEQSREELEKFIGRITRRLGVNMPPKELLEEIEQRSGLLIERSIGVFGFSHLTLQEYLVAKHLQLNPAYQNVIFENLDRQEWREVLLLYAGLLDDATRLIEEVASAKEKGGIAKRRVVLAGYCIGDAQNCDAEVSSAIIRLLLSWMTYRRNDEEVMGALAAIAADYADEPVSEEEKLSAELIRLMADDKEPAGVRTDCASVLSRAKVTKALPALTGVLARHDPSVTGAVRTALVSFGNLAIPEIEKRVHAGGPRYFLYDYIPVLKDINTGAAAKTLIGFYGLERIEDYEDSVSAALSQMLSNPFTESDIQQTQASQLPAPVRAVTPDGDGWPYESLPANSGFLHLDTLIRAKLSGLLSPHTALLDAGNAIIRRASFKLVFPEFLKRIRTWPSALAQVTGPPTSVLRSYLIERLGFSAEDFDRLEHLVAQIKGDPSLRLDYALSRAPASEDADDAAEQSRGRKATIFAAVAVLTLYAACQLSFTWSLADDLPRVNLREGDAILDGMFVVLAPTFHVSIFALTLAKLRRHLYPYQYVLAALVPYVFFLKVLPYTTRGKRLWVKSLTYHLAMFASSIGGVLCLFALYQIFAAKETSLPLDFPAMAITYGLVSLLPVGASLLYLKHRVLARNPILQLILLHPEGRRLVGAGER